MNHHVLQSPDFLQSFLVLVVCRKHPHFVWHFHFVSLEGLLMVSVSVSVGLDAEGYILKCNVMHQIKVFRNSLNK